jgi:hypothetical protein
MHILLEALGMMLLVPRCSYWRKGQLLDIPFQKFGRLTKLPEAVLRPPETSRSFAHVGKYTRFKALKCFP